MGFPSTNAEIVNDALFRAGELTDGSSDYETVALQYLNRIYLKIAAGGSELNKDVNEKWWWLRAEYPQPLTLLPVVEGTVQVVKGSTSIVFNVAPVDSLVGRYIRFNGTQDVFRITTHIAADVLAELDSLYTGPDSLGESYTAAKMEYTFPDNVMEVLSPMRVYQQGNPHIDGMDPEAMEREWPISQMWHGVPKAFTQVGNNKLRFSHQGGQPGEFIRVDFDYLMKPTQLAKDSGTPLMPEEYRTVLADFVGMMICFDKDDNKAQDLGSMAKAGLLGMAMENRRRLTQVSRNMGQIITRPNQTARSRYPLRTTGGRIVG